MEAGSTTAPAPTYFTVADAGFFLGLVAMVNSLALTGNRGRIVVRDGGLTPRQRALVAPHVELFQPPPAPEGHPPELHAPFPHLLAPRGVVVLIDSDMMVTSSLDELLGSAASGRICMFSDYQADRDRWFAEWQEGFGLSRPPRRQPYLNAGLLAFSTDHHPRLLEWYYEATAKVPPERTRGRAPKTGPQPYLDGDQDALNAVLMSEVPDGAVKEYPQHAAPTAERLMWVDVVDPERLACEVRGTPTLVLHQTSGPKPFQRRGWKRVRANGYVKLLPRVLFAPDVPIRLDPATVPLWIRPGRLGALALAILSPMNGAALQIERLHPRRVRAKLVKVVRARLGR